MLWYGIEGEDNYYTANVREVIGKGNWGGTADEIAYSIANGFRNSKGHWAYVGSSKYTYMVVGVMHDGYYCYVCICIDSENTDLKKIKTAIRENCGHLSCTEKTTR